MAMYCKYCGKRIDEDSIYCSYCGRRINEGRVLLENFEKTEENEDLPKDLDEDIAHIIQRVEEEFREQQGIGQKSLEHKPTPPKDNEVKENKISSPSTSENKQMEEKEETSLIFISVASDSEFASAWKDKKGVSYDIDSKLLLKGSSEKCITYSIPKKVVCICDYAFYKDNFLQAISFPRSLHTIGSFAFADCEKLKEVLSHKGIKTIKEGAFKNCSSLKNIHLYEGIETIGDEAFCNCTSLKKIILPDSLKEIGERVFEGCTSLKAVFVPKSKIEFFKERLKLEDGVIKPKSNFWEW